MRICSFTTKAVLGNRWYSHAEEVKYVINSSGECIKLSTCSLHNIPKWYQKWRFLKMTKSISWQCEVHNKGNNRGNGKVYRLVMPNTSLLCVCHQCEKKPHQLVKFLSCKIYPQMESKSFFPNDQVAKCCVCVTGFFYKWISWFGVATCCNTNVKMVKVFVMLTLWLEKYTQIEC